MAMTPYSQSPLVISILGTTPQERGLETQQFKAKFDEGLKEFTEWFNATHKTEFELVQTDLATHLAEVVSHLIVITRDISLDGIQTISGLPFKPKSIHISGFISGTISVCEGFYADNAQQGHNNDGTTNFQYISPTAIAFSTGSAIYTSGTIQNITDTSFDISWVKTGEPNGTATMIINIIGH